ncbi:hypothetical protein EDB86DRAFT_3154786 [Lactarius hatsudake]|nr:hypothetical protein EDB86DRAFT_3154786 [Lactarius hatsudake]
MPLGLTFSFPVEQMVLDLYEKFISGMYLGEITRDTLLALRRGRHCRGAHGGPGEARSCHVSVPEEAGDRAGALRLRTMRGLPARRSARRPPLCAAERVSRRDRRALDGLRQRAREGSTASSVVGVGGKLYAIGLNWSLDQHCPGFDECTREEICEKRVEMGLAKDGSGVGSASSL